MKPATAAFVTRPVDLIQKQRDMFIALHRLLFCTLTILALASCTKSPDCFRDDIFCAALVTDTLKLNDHGLTQDTWVGLQQSQSDGVIDHIAYIESVDARDYEKNIAFFVDAGYDVIITSGIGLQNATLHGADLYPDSVFIGINQTDDESRSNFIPVTFPEDQMGFFAGALATHLTKTNIVGAVCETSGIDAMWRYCEGFRAGVKYENKSVQALIVYRDNESSSKLFIDDQWGYENAQTLIHDGADVVFAAGGVTAVGALRAADDAKIISIGAERDQATALAEKGSRVATSIFGQTSSTVQELMRTLKAGQRVEAETDPVGYIHNANILPPDLLAHMNELLAGLANSSIKTAVPRAKP